MQFSNLLIYSFLNVTLQSPFLKNSYRYGIYHYCLSDYYGLPERILYIRKKEVYIFTGKPHNNSILSFAEVHDLSMVISVIRTFLLYLLILFAVRMMGKRQISEMQTSELVITLLMSNIATIPMQDTEQSLLSGVVPIMVLLVSEILLSYWMLKQSKIRKLVCGKPVIVINNGTIDQNAMTELRMTTEDLFEQLRQKDVFDINEVAFAIIETNGQLSILKKAENDPVTLKDMSLYKPKKELNVVIISDGELSPSSLHICGWNKERVQKILQQEHTALQEVFIMTANTGGQYQIIRKEKT